MLALWLFLLAYRREFDSAPPARSRSTEYPVPHSEAAEGRSAVAVSSAGLERV